MSPSRQRTICFMHRSPPPPAWLSLHRHHHTEMMMRLQWAGLSMLSPTH